MPEQAEGWRRPCPAKRTQRSLGASPTRNYTSQHMKPSPSRSSRPRTFLLCAGLLGLLLAPSPLALAQPAAAPAEDQDEGNTLYWSMERLLRRASNPDNISLDLNPKRMITVEVPGAPYNVDTVAEVLEVLENDRYRVRVKNEIKVYSGQDLRRLNLPYLLADGTRVLAGASKLSGAIVKVDRANDPALRAFLAEAQAIEKRWFTSEDGKLKLLVELVNKRIKYPGHETKSTEAYDKLEKAHKGREVHFGEYLEIGQGVCRHKAIAMKLALEAIGFPSRYVAGEALHRTTGEVRGGHAWVEAITAKGRRLMIDPTWHDPGIQLSKAYNTDTVRRPKPGAKRIIPPGESVPTHLADLSAELLEPYRRADGTVEWPRLLRERGAREAAGLGHFTLALFLKELAVVAQSGDRLRIEEFFDALATSDFYTEYGLFALGARVGEVAYSRYLERFVKPRFVNGILKTNLVLATGLALPQLVRGTFEGKAFAISLGSLGLSSAAVKTGVRGLTWVKELSSARRVTTAARVGAAARLAKVGGFLYTAAELAVVLYLADEIEGRVNAWLDDRAAREALGQAGQALFAAARAPGATPESVSAAAEAYHEAWDAYRDYLYRPLIQEDLLLAQRLERSAEAAKVAADRRQAALERISSRSALLANIEGRYGSLEAYAETLAAKDEEEIGRDVDAALAHYERARAEALEALYEAPRRPGNYLDGVEHLDYLAGKGPDPYGTRSDFFARRGRDRLQAGLTAGFEATTRNKLQTYEDEARALGLVRGLLSSDLAQGLSEVEGRLARQRELDARLAGGATQVELRPSRGAAGTLRAAGAR